MRNPLAIGAAILLVTLSFGVAACGSGDDSSDETLTYSELVTQADEVCSTYNDELASAISELPAQPSQEDLKAFVTDGMVPIFRDQIDDLRELQPSEEDAAAYSKMIDTLESEVDAAEADPAATVQSEDPFPQATALANDFGLTVCGAN